MSRLDDFHRKIRKDEDFRRKMEKKRSMRSSLSYAGVGSRETPNDVLVLMTKLGEVLREEGFTLRSGHANGADLAFQYGARSAAEIFLPWRGFNQEHEFALDYDVEEGSVRPPVVHVGPSDRAMYHASYVHPAWESLSQPARLLHARNAHQVLGKSLDAPVEFVICWTPGGHVVGGTATAIRIAEQHDIPVWNLAHEDTYDMAFEWAWAD